jgi:hypothetical protein
MTRKTDVVLILGSGPNAPEARLWPRRCFDRIVAINNAWAVREDWDDLVFPEDFPPDRRPADLAPGQRLIEADQFIPAQNTYGGIVHAGGTMAFTAGYWALDALRPRVLAYLGCDMVYPTSGPTHYYGTGAADPLRDDATLQDLSAKSARLAMIAAAQGCLCVNLSKGPSRLLFPRAEPLRLQGMARSKLPVDALEPLLSQERALGYDVPSGRYWEEAERFDRGAIARIDAAWRAAWEQCPELEQLRLSA